MTETATPSDLDPHEWSAALCITVGGWIDFLGSPRRLEARAVWLRGRTDPVVGDDGLTRDDDLVFQKLERENSLENLGALIDHLGELADDPDRLEARAAALRAADVAAEAAEAKWGKAGASWLDGYPLPNITGS